MKTNFNVSDSQLAQKVCCIRNSNKRSHDNRIIKDKIDQKYKIYN